MPSKTLLINSALGAVILALGAGTYLTVTAAGSNVPAASSRSVAVGRASISAVATASGSVSATTTVVNAQNCSGPITSVPVALGQQVTAGQLLLAIDPTNAQNALDAAQAQLDSVSAQAGQQQVTANNQVSSANQGLVNAQQTAALDASQQAAAVAAAQKAVDNDTAALAAAHAQPVPAVKPANYVDPAISAQAQLTKDQQALAQAQSQQAASQLKDSQQVSTAGVALTNARNTAGAGSSANATSAQIAVDTAQKNLASCTLNAPVAGTVTAVNAVVGALAGSSGSGGSTSASGSASGTSAGSASSATSASAASAGSGLVTISDTAHLQVVAGFSESDIENMKVGETAQFTFPAVKEDAGAAPVTGKVVSIAQTSTTTNGVVTYPVTVSVDNAPKSLRLGQSANISVTTATADNALLVPTLAITTNGNRQTVNVLRNGTPTGVPVTTGITASGRTQVLTGLSDGDQVELPAISSTLDSGTTTARNGFGGLGTGGAGAGGAGTGGTRGGSGGAGGAGGSNTSSGR
jgi:multidrug efflux pump subunit AcrA (membrane-fusion protein)